MRKLLSVPTIEILTRVALLTLAGITGLIASTAIHQLPEASHQAGVVSNTPRARGRLTLQSSTQLLKLGQPEHFSVTLDTAGLPLGQYDIHLTYPPQTITVDTVLLDQETCPTGGEADTDSTLGIITINCPASTVNTHLQLINLASITYHPTQVGTAIFHLDPAGMQVLTASNPPRSLVRFTDDLPLTITP